jgi:hypothetical protein
VRSVSETEENASDLFVHKVIGKSQMFEIQESMMGHGLLPKPAEESQREEGGEGREGD